MRFPELTNENISVLEQKLLVEKTEEELDFIKNAMTCGFKLLRHDPAYDVCGWNAEEKENALLKA